MAPVFILLLVSIGGFGLSILLKVKEKNLGDEDIQIRFGTLYQGREVTGNKTYLLSIVFFTRRLLFILSTIYFKDYPLIQIYVSQALTLSSIIYVTSSYLSQYKSKLQRWLEVCSEFLLYTVTVFFSLFNDLSFDQEAHRLIEKLSLSFIGMLFFINFGYMIFCIISGCLI